MNNNEVNFNSACLDSSANSVIPPSQATINAMNALWFMTYGLGQAGGSENTSLNLQMLAQAISELVSANPPYGPNDPTSKILSELTAGGNNSVAALAAAFLKDPTNADAEGAFMVSMQGLESSDGFSSEVNSWWGQEGFQNSHVTINPPPGLPEKALQKLIGEIQDYMAGTGNISGIITDIPYINQLLSGGNLDPYSQMLYNLLNTPLNPNDPNSSLAALVKSGNTNELGYYLHENGFGSVLANQMSIIVAKEWGDG